VIPSRIASLFRPPAAPALPKSIAFVGSARATADNVAIADAVVAGDMILVFAVNVSGVTIPSTPAGWSAPLATQATASAVAGGGFFARVIGSNGEITNSGAFTNAGRIAYAHYRPTNGTLAIVGTPVKANSSGGGTGFLDVQALVAPGTTSWGISVTFAVNSVTVSSGQTLTTRVGPLGSARAGFVDSNGPTAGTYAGETWTLSGANGGMITMSAELGIS
jgi:uncharacterized integral membrane protein